MSTETNHSATTETNHGNTTDHEVRFRVWCLGTDYSNTIEHRPWQSNLESIAVLQSGTSLSPAALPTGVSTAK